MNPRIVDLPTLAASLCITEAEVEKWTADGTLPAPIRRRPPMWLWSSVDNAMSGRGGVDRQIYFVEAMGFIKIGISRSVEHRLHELSQHLPCALTLLHTMPGDFDCELNLHRKFAHLRSRGEWFRRDPELLEFVEQKRGEESGKPV